MGFRSARELFDHHCVNVTVDKDFCRRLHRYRTAFANKNADHVAFFGGNTLGVQTVRFTQTDQNIWFSDIVEADDLALADGVAELPPLPNTPAGRLAREDLSEADYALQLSIESLLEWELSIESFDGAPTLKKIMGMDTVQFANFKVAGNVFNISCIWLCYAIWRSTKISTKEKHEAMIDTLLVLHYRFITSLLFNYFRYPADPAVAEATYASLSMKYDIKRYGSWGVLLRARCEDMLSQGSIHRRTLEAMESDQRLVYALSDSQGRIRDMVKNIYVVMLQVKENGSRVITESAFIEHEGEEILKDVDNGFSGYVRYVQSIVADRNSFIQHDLGAVIEDLVSTMPPKLFYKTLAWFSDSYRGKTALEINDFLSQVLIHSFTYLVENNRSVKHSVDLPTLLMRLKGVYMSSRSSDPALLELRDTTESYVTMATSNHVASVVASVRNGVLLYIVARAMTRKHYTQ